MRLLIREKIFHFNKYIISDSVVNEKQITKSIFTFSLSFKKFKTMEILRGWNYKGNNKKII